jgi:hypothetical protein
LNMELSKTEVEAVIDYIFQHSRTSPNGKAYKVWKKMFDFINAKPEDSKQAGLFEGVKG